MKTIVLDDDPTGTQSATGATVLLDWDVDTLVATLADADSVYVQTNSRALKEPDAVDIVSRIKADGEAAARLLGTDVRFVLRGDSTLRGHVFAESDVFLDQTSILLFVPAFPEGGRTTRGGVHFVSIGGRDIPAHESEYADDPVFPFSTGVLADYVTEKSGRSAVGVDLDTVRGGGLAAVLAEAPAGSVVVPDAVTAGDIAAIAAATDAATRGGRRIVVRAASPLAAELAGVASTGLLESPLVGNPVSVLLVCGSHTAGATAQIDAVSAAFGEPTVIDTADALRRPSFAGLTAADAAAGRLATGNLTVVASERDRSAEHNTLDHGEKVMAALTAAVHKLLPRVDVVVAKGGITSAEVARTGIGATSAKVLGQVLPGVSVWRMSDRSGRQILYVVVPGNVGGPDTLLRVLEALRIHVGAEAGVGAVR